MILTRIDRPGERSRAWVSGDCAETMPMYAKIRRWDDADDDPGSGRVSDFRSERLKRKDHTFDPKLPTWYGGGFWEKVTIGPVQS
jgi:hypothetical protein